MPCVGLNPSWGNRFEEALFQVARKTAPRALLTTSIGALSVVRNAHFFAPVPAGNALERQLALGSHNPKNASAPLRASYVQFD